MNVIFLPLNKKETVSGAVLAAVYFVIAGLLEAVLPMWFYPLQFVFVLLLSGAVGFTARRFWAQAFRDIPLIGTQLIWKPLLAVAVCKVICVAFNDLALFFQLPYFVMTDWGPMLWDVREDLMEYAADGNLIPTVLTVVLLMPIAEEFIFRGVILGSIYQKSSIPAFLVSVLLFAVFRTVPYMARMDDLTYTAIYAVQFIPMGLFLGWLYISTDSIFAPILMHILYNAILIF